MCSLAFLECHHPAVWLFPFLPLPDFPNQLLFLQSSSVDAPLTCSGLVLTLVIPLALPAHSPSLPFSWLCTVTIRFLLDGCTGDTFTGNIPHHTDFLKTPWFLLFLQLDIGLLSSSSILKIVCPLPAHMPVPTVSRMFLY